MKLLVDPSGSRVLIPCACGDLSHGGLLLRPDAVADEPQLLASIWFVPAQHLGIRISQAWNLLLGRAVSSDVIWDRSTARETADWLLAFAGGGEEA